MARQPARLYNALRVRFYRLLSARARVHGNYRARQPVLLSGKGSFHFDEGVELGFFPSPFFFSGYTHIEARSTDANIRFGKRVKLNNCCVLISDGEGIFFGDDVLLGTRVEIYDTDFHGLLPEERHIAPPTQAVHIGNRVFIGSNAVILKGVRIGDNSVVANSAVVTRDVPANCVVGGNPAKVIRRFDDA